MAQYASEADCWQCALDYDPGPGGGTVDPKYLCESCWHRHKREWELRGYPLTHGCISNPCYICHPELLGEPRTTDYCLNCGHSPDSGDHLFGKCTYKDPRQANYAVLGCTSCEVNRALMVDAAQKSQENEYLVMDLKAARQQDQTKIDALRVEIGKLEHTNSLLRKALNAVAKVMFDGGSFDDASDAYDRVMGT